MKTSLLLVLFCALLSAHTNAQNASVIQFGLIWGADPTMRLDTLTGKTTDSIRTNFHTFKIVTDYKYQCSYYPAECDGILVFTDVAGNVQNYVVKSYEFEYYNGNLMRGGWCHGRDFGQVIYAIQHHPIGDYVNVTKVTLADLAGKPIPVKIPPFKIVKTR
jgi:hypothetical protein